MEEFQRIILVHYHEIGLKGRNRGVFEKRLQKNLEALLGAYPVVTIHRISGRLLVFLREGTTLEVANQCTDAILGVPGVARASRVDGSLSQASRHEDRSVAVRGR